MSYPARQIDTTKPYKLRIYVKSGIHKGDLKRQEYFSNRIRLGERSKELDVRLPCTSCCKKYYLR